MTDSQSLRATFRVTSQSIGWLLSGAVVVLVISSVDSLGNEPSSGPRSGRYEREWEAPRSGNTYYVRVSGNDNATGRSPQQAWRTLNRAARVVAPGDVVYVGAGVYEESVQCTRPAQANRRVFFVADTTGSRTGDAGTVVVQPTNAYAFVLSRARYYSLVGFTLRRGSGGENYGIYAYQADGLQLIQCRFDNAVYYGVVAVSTSLNVTGSVFDSVRSYPIISYYSDLSVTQSELRRAGAYAIYHISSTSNPAQVHLADSIVKSNYGGPYVTHGRLVIENTRIENNQYWGIVSAYGNLEFRRQTPGLSRNGYGLYIIAPPNNRNVRLENYVFRDVNNYALYAVNCNLDLRNCLFESNNGWALTLLHSSCTAHRSILRNNAHGVLAYTDSNSGVMSMEGLTIESNRGYGFYHYCAQQSPGRIRINGIRCQKNGSIGVASLYGELRVDDCLISQNGAYGIYYYVNVNDPRTLTVRQTRITGNGSHGVVGYYGDVELERCEVRDNGGYAAYVVADRQQPWNRRARMHLRRCVLVRNYGGPYAAYSRMTVDDCRIEENRYWGLVCDYGDFRIINQTYAITKNGYGLYLSGDGPGGIRVLARLNVSENGAYGLYLRDCQAELRDCRIERMQSWAMALSGAVVTFSNSPVRSSGHGILVYSQASNRLRPRLTGAVVEKISGYGIYHAGNSQQPDQLVLANCTIRDSSSWGLVSYYGNADLSDCRVSRCGGGVYLYSSRNAGGVGSHSLKNGAIEECRSHGIVAYYSNVTATNIAIRANTSGYALYCADDGSVPWENRTKTVLKGCSITGNYGGPYVHYARLTVDQCTIEQNTYWGLVCNYGDFEIVNQRYAISGNGYGLYLAGDGPQGARVLRGLDVSGNGNYGLYAVDCRLELFDCRIESMQGWGMALVGSSLTASNSPVRNNGHGLVVYSKASDRYRPVLKGAQILDNAGYGIYYWGNAKEPDVVSIENALVQGNRSWALVAYYANVNASHLMCERNGGGLYLYRDRANGGVGTHRLDSCQVTNGQSYGLYVRHSSVEANRCIWSRNQRGYAVYCQDDATVDWPNRVQVALRNCEIAENYGGPYVSYAKLVIDNSRIEGNTYWGLVCQYGDFQIINQAYAVRGNGYGLYVAGDGPNGPRRFRGLDVSDNGAYGLYAVDCQLELENCHIERMKSWAVALSGSSLVAKQTPIVNNAHGLLVYSNSTSRYRPIISGAEIRENTGYAIYHSGNPQARDTLRLENCQLSKNGSLSVVSYHGNVEVSDCSITDSGAGMYIYCNRQNGGPGTHRIRNTNISACRSYGVYCYQGNVDLSDCTISDIRGGYAVYAYDDPSIAWDARATVRVVNSRLLRNYGGPYGAYTHLLIDNSTINGNQYWAAVAQYGKLTFLGDNRSLSGNGYGLYVAGDEPQGVRRLERLNLSKIGAYALYAVDCNVVLDQCVVSDINSWAAVLQGATLVANDSPMERCGHGVYIRSRSDRRSPVVQHLVLRDCAGYALYHYSDASAPAALRVNSCRVERYGGYGLISYYGPLVVEQSIFLGDRDKAQHGILASYCDTVTIDRTIIQGNRQWAVISYANNLRLRNTVLGNSGYGAYVYQNPNRPTSAEIWNCTVGQCPGYGIYQHGGQTQLINTIVAAQGGNYGIVVTGNGSMYRANNLLFGYRVPSTGTFSVEAEVTGNPAFTDPAAGDFSLSAASAAINQGRDMPGKVDVDIVGLTRPKYGKWEIGAYEYPFAAGVRVVNWVEVR